MNSLEEVRPGKKPLFLIQKMDANAPLKKIPSTAAKATISSAKSLLLCIQLIAHCSFFLMAGKCCAALNKIALSFSSGTSLSISSP
uniref:Wsv190 n=1 Tax=White spot syndrome virus TaxID=92652 RepID=A0A2U9G8G5_WSSV|nr:wsv190 [Shrimp white spot syndrome virus]AWQ60778.1 wsv190 [Shrimp white spot syndrome virus]AWQ61194.1 wsv190 [Shrimp white spot syndrome virus]AWQ61636.1 wsv190 [Shrimp white spot syndrome virus]AWQ62874.1 wsv190 [Shrimp white spot syndrome virus]